MSGRVVVVNWVWDFWRRKSCDRVSSRRDEACRAADDADSAFATAFETNSSK